ncbi:MAG: hypothetical protein QXU79_00115 [Candidatus Micrarchaeaceae archaeon]
MIRADVEVTIENKGDLEHLIKTFVKLSRAEVHVGMFAELCPEKTLIAAWVNEFGAVIPKTPKMRAFLAAMARELGVTLDPTKGHGNVIVIPPRPWLRRAFDTHAGKIAAFVEDILKTAFAAPSDRIPAETILFAIGEKAVQVVRTTMDEVSEPPLHPLTVARKGHDNPLIHTGTMRRMVAHKEVIRGA